MFHKLTRLIRYNCFLLVERSKIELLLDAALCSLNSNQLEIVFDNETDSCCNEIYNSICLKKTDQYNSECFTYKFYHNYLFKRCFHPVSVEYRRAFSSDDMNF